MVTIEWRFHPMNDFISALKTAAHRSSAYLKWLRGQKCFSCPSKNDITASHLWRGYHGLKNHDWASVPMCGWCHWEFEYHYNIFSKRRRVPTEADAERYYRRFLSETGREDDRTPEQLKPI